MRRATPVAAALALAGCFSHGQTGLFEHGHNDYTEMKAPKGDRCASYADAPSTHKQCLEFKQAGVTYLRSLNTGDAVCMDGGIGEDPRHGCKARGEIVDADDKGFLIEIRDPALDSKWKNHDHKRIYFENGALLDQYLREKGYE